MTAVYLACSWPPDFMMLILITIPLYMLYEVSIGVVRRVG